MPQLIGFSHSPRHQMPKQPLQRPRQEAGAEDSEEALRRRLYADRMRIRKTQAIPQPKWGWIGATLLAVALALGIGIGMGGGLVAVGIGLGWLSVTLIALIWNDLGHVYKLWQAQQ